MRQVTGRFRCRPCESFQRRLDIVTCDDSHTLGELLREDVQEAFDVRSHVLWTDADGGHDDTHPVDVIGEESRAGRQDGGREMGEVELGILDAFLPAPLTIAWSRSSG